jgi:hypothetical protein
MSRLLRPPIPIDVKCRVVLRQLGTLFLEEVIQANRYDRRAREKRSLGALLAHRLEKLAECLGCTVKDLRLDHNPALGARVKVFEKGVHVDYMPGANDPDFLEYRPHGPQFARSHLIKTNVRGDGAQHPDRVLIKKNRRLEKREAERRSPRGVASGSPRTPSYVKRTSVSGVNSRPAKRKWGSRPLKSASRWPKRGFRRKKK